MVALVGTFGLFHLAQQRIHLGQAQAVLATDGGMAGAGAEQAFAPGSEIGLRGRFLQRVEQFLEQPSPAGTWRMTSVLGPASDISNPRSVSATGCSCQAAISRSLTLTETGMSSGCRVGAAIPQLV